MKKIIFIILILFFFHTQTFSLENKIILKIDNKIITEIDLLNEIKYLQALNPKLKNLNKYKMYEIAKASLIREKIKDIEISKYTMKVNPKYIENVLKNIYSNIGFESKKEFLNYISNLNIEINTIEDKLSIEALWNNIIYDKFINKIKVDREKILNDIKSNKNKGTSFNLYEILFNPKNIDESEEILKKINNSIEENGFENTASIFSISSSSKTGGKIGWIDESALSKKILENISHLKAGDYTDPILIPGGFLILYIKDKKIIERQIDFNDTNLNKELSFRIRQLQNQQLNQYSNIYFNKIKKDILINEK